MQAEHKCFFCISIHALRGEGDSIGKNIVAGMKQFQSTPSVGRATACVLLFVGFFFISIHALRGEGDHTLSDPQNVPIKFQSTPSVGRAT